MPKVIAVVNGKGGVAKTTTAVNLAAALARRGRDVILIDWDPQGGATEALGDSAVETGSPLLEFFFNNGSLAASIRHYGQVKYPGELCYIPSNINLVALEFRALQAIAEASDTTVAYQYLKRVVQHKFLQKYDYIIIDTAPTLGLLAINAILAADYLIIPTTTSFLDGRGLANLLYLLDSLTTDLQHKTNILGILPTMYNGRTRHAKETLREIVAVANAKKITVFSHPISESTRVPEATKRGLPIWEYDARCPAAVQYLNLAAEVERMVGAKHAS